MRLISECILSVIKLHVMNKHIMCGPNNFSMAIGGPKDIFVCRGGGGYYVNLISLKRLNFSKLKNFQPPTPTSISAHAYTVYYET